MSQSISPRTHAISASVVLVVFYFLARSNFYAPIETGFLENVLFTKAFYASLENQRGIFGLLGYLRGEALSLFVAVAIGNLFLFRNPRKQALFLVILGIIVAIKIFLDFLVGSKIGLNGDFSQIKFIFLAFLFSIAYSSSLKSYADLKTPAQPVENEQ